MWLISFSALLMVAAPPGDEAPVPTSDQVVFCGGETDLATVERYFSDLHEALTSSRPETRFNRFVDDRFGVRSTLGRTIYFDLGAGGSVTPERITIREWEEIARRGSPSLRDAGWRGCFMDNGKVWFEASSENGFRLTFIAQDKPWIAPVGE